MAKEQVLGSYLMRFTQKEQQRHVTVQNLKTGERLEFETWLSVWAYLDAQLISDNLDELPRAPPLEKPD